MPPRFRGPVLLASAFVAAFLPTGASAQISPGPLAEAHASLDAADRCFDCHGPGRERGAITERCLDCHREIRARRDRGEGYHGLSAPGDCASCHPEHGGRDFALIEWPGGSRDAFDHDRTGWPLDGRHRLAKCVDCHRPDRVRGEVATRDGPRDAAGTFLGLDPSCAGCHDDPHRDALGSGCTDCHGFTAWRPARNFDHARTAYPLDGKHLEVDCAKCHPAAADPDAAGTSRVFKPIAHVDCTPCHADVHAGRFTGACSACHVTAGFRILSEDGFDHARTGWPLTGKHRPLDCARCHDPEKAWGRRPRRDSCSGCHRDVHAGAATLAGKPADCASCHDTGGFRPSTYDAVDHVAAPYPLAGKHRAVDCARCHRPGPGSAVAARPDRAGVTLRPAASRCTDCHEDAHGGQLASRDGAGECGSCHVVDGWRPSTYGVAEHAATRLPLDGRHEKTACRDCHAADRPNLPPLGPEIARGKAAVALSTLDPRCETCHRDPHDGKVRPVSGPADGCRSCHGADSFRPARVDTEMHARFSYPLEGAHRVVPCVACHEELRAEPTAASTGDPRRLTFAVRHERCADCHESPHAGTMSAANERAPCDRCHDVEGFRPASRFDHDRDTTFSLGGGHRRVPCASCHPSGIGPDGPARVRYRPTPTACRDCHAERDDGPTGGKRTEITDR